MGDIFGDSASPLKHIKTGDIPLTWQSLLMCLGENSWVYGISNWLIDLNINQLGQLGMRRHQAYDPVWADDWVDLFPGLIIITTSPT